MDNVVYFANGNVIENPTHEQMEQQDALNKIYWQHFFAERDRLLAALPKPLPRIPPAHHRAHWRKEWERINSAAAIAARSKMKG